MSEACIACGRAPGLFAVTVTIAGRTVRESPSAWIYAHRESGSVGLCNQCFGSRSFEGLSADEVRYFEEEFAKPIDDENGGA